MDKAALYEEASEDWVPVREVMTALVGTAAMTVGNLLWLDDGKRMLVGHVNAMFGTNAHCRFPCIPIVRAWRKFVDAERLAKTPPAAWATAFDLDEDIFDFVETHEYPEVAKIARPMNDVGSLDWQGNIQPGLVAGMEDGRVVLVGHVNALAGVCDSQIDGASDNEGHDHRVLRYFRAVPECAFRTRRYEP